MSHTPSSQSRDCGSLRDPHGACVRWVPSHPVPSPGLVHLALAYVADGTVSDPETPALLRRTAREHLATDAAHAAAVEASALPRLPITEGFVLVDYEIRPGVRSYRLAKLPANVWWRIRIGAFERHVHRTLVILWRRLGRFFAAALALAPEARAGLLAPRARRANDVVVLGPASH